MCCLGMGHTQSQCVRQTSKKVWVAKKTIVQQLEPPKQKEGKKEVMEQSFQVVRKPARRSLIVAPATVVQNDFNALDRATKED